MSNNNPLDLNQFMRIVMGNPGITRKEMIDRLKTTTARLNSAQRLALKQCWLFVQAHDREPRYFMMKYAVDNKLPLRVKVKNLANRTVSGHDHSAYTMDFLKHCRLIDSCWLIPAH